MRIAESDLAGDGDYDSTTQRPALLVAYEHIRQLNNARSEEQSEIFRGDWDKRVAEELIEDEAPWIPLLEREPAAIGPLLAAYDTVDAL